MASVLRWDRIGVLLLLMDACLLSGVVSLNVTGKPATQSSTAPDRYGETFVAGNAVDRMFDTFSHTAYDTAEQKTDPWWRLDLEDVYCLRNVTIYNTQNKASRLAGAEVRAGLNPDRLSNRLIGTVTLQQATDTTRPIEISVDPVVNARYVRVDLPGTNKILAMCEVQVGEYEDK